MRGKSCGLLRSYGQVGGDPYRGLVGVGVVVRAIGVVADDVPVARVEVRVNGRAGHRVDRVGGRVDGQVVVRLRGVVRTEVRGATVRALRARENRTGVDVDLAHLAGSGVGVLQGDAVSVSAGRAGDRDGGKAAVEIQDHDVAVLEVRGCGLVNAGHRCGGEGVIAYLAGDAEVSGAAGDGAVGRGDGDLVAVDVVDGAEEGSIRVADDVLCRHTVAAAWSSRRGAVHRSR